jgi:hypothetical protein
MNNYAFISLLYPNKQGQWTYLDGAILTALGLRKQQVKHKIICMVTPDVTSDISDLLKIVYDQVIIVDYISPLKTANIKIQGKIFSSDIYTDDNTYNDLANIFTKLHIFDSKKFPYEKIIFIDNDLIPIANFDNLTTTNTPAGWQEKIIEIDNSLPISRYTRVWGTWDNIPHNHPIPKKQTEIYKEPGSSINAGLLVIKPDKKLFDHLVNKLQQEKTTWFGPEYNHKGVIGLDRKLSDRYIFPEQDFLTQELSGQWHMIDGRYCAWGKHSDEEIYGMHMAGLKYEIQGQWKNYKSWMVQIPIEDGFSTITNEIAIWGIINYPALKGILMANLKIYIGEKLIDFDKIAFLYFIQLTESQQELHNILYDKYNENFSICLN